MNYNKPEITSLASASFVIQGSMSKTIQHEDNAHAPFESTSAYQADE